MPLTDSNVLLFVAGFWAVALLISLLRAPGRVQWGWFAKCILTVAAAAWLFSGPSWAGYAVMGWVAVFGYVPIMSGRRAVNASRRGDYMTAQRAMRVAVLLHPFDGYPAQMKYFSVVNAARRGDTAPAEALLSRIDHGEVSAPSGFDLMLLHLIGRWEEVLDRGRAYGLEQNPNARGTGIISFFAVLAYMEGLAPAWALYQTMERKIPAAFWQVYRARTVDLALAMAAGDVALTQLLGHDASAQPAASQLQMLSARRNAGEDVREELRGLLATDLQARTKARIEERIAETPRPKVMIAPDVAAALARISADVQQRRRFGLEAHSDLPARVTHALFAANAIAFGFEVWRHALENDAMLVQVGGLVPALVRRGQYWRLLSHGFLHGSIAHFALNMIALLLFAPFVERTLGRARFALLYFVCLIGGGAAYMQFGVRTPEQAFDVLVGASGAIMGLIGASAAIMLLGWRRYGRGFAQRRFRAFAVLILLQFAGDQLFPQVSSLVHFFGMLIGFLLALVLMPREKSINL